MARGRAGRPLADIADAQLAGIAVATARRGVRHVTLATRNVTDFAGLDVVNPWQA